MATPRSNLFLFIALAGAAAGLAAIGVLGGHWREPPLVVRAPMSGEPVAALCAEASKHFCARLERCGGLDKAQLLACIERHALDCDADIGWRIRRGILAIDAEAEEECLEAMEKARCNAVAFVLGDDEQDIFEVTDRCEMEELLRPDAGLGARCERRSDCRAGSCLPDDAGCSACAMTAPPVLLERDSPCETPKQCRDGVCRTDRRCGARADGESCEGAADCAPASFCRASTRRCEPRVKKGERCELDERANVCADGEASCIEGRCQVRPYDVGAGDICRAFSDCKEGMYCRWTRAVGVEGVCAPIASSCRMSDYGACGVSGRCVDGTCRPLASQGEQCLGPFGCKAQLDCFRGRCLPAAELGEPCDGSRSCRQGQCRAGRCERLLASGAACSSPLECGSGRCLDGHCGPSCR